MFFSPELILFPFEFYRMITKPKTLKREWNKEGLNQKDIHWLDFFVAVVRVLFTFPFPYVSLKNIRRHMPVNIKRLSEEQLTYDETPNGKYLPKKIAKRFKRINVLQSAYPSDCSFQSTPSFFFPNFFLVG